MKILLKFEYDNTYYCVTQCDRKIKYATLNGDKFDFDLSKDQIMLINAVVDRISPSDKRIKLMDYKFKGKTYQVLLDPKTNIRHFLPVPNDDILYELNIIFNNMDECVYDNRENEHKHLKKNDHRFIKRITGIGNKAVIVLVASSLIVSGAKLVVDNYPDIIYGVNEVAVSHTKRLSTEEIMRIVDGAILNNHNLSTEEKEKVIDFLSEEIFFDSKNYMDIGYIKEVFSDIEIKYVSELSSATVGAYNPTTNLITFYGANNLLEVDDETFAHELCHSLQKFNYIEHNTFLIETINTIFNEEYCIEDYCVYRHYYNYTKALMEIIGSEPLLKYHNYASARPIVNKLVGLCGTKEDATRLLANLNDYGKLYNKVIGGNTDQNEGWENLNYLNNQIVAALEKYYFAKYHISIDDDMVMLYYLKPDVFLQKLAEMNIREFIVHNERTYFNSKHRCDDIVIYKSYSSHQYNDDGITYMQTFDYQGNKVETIGWVFSDEEGKWHQVSSESRDMTKEEINDKEYLLVINNDNRYLDTKSDEEETTISQGRTI